MPYEVFLAFRYLRSRHKRRLARATSIAAILGISMGVAALIVAFALSNGFRDEMKRRSCRALLTSVCCVLMDVRLRTMQSSRDAAGS